MQAQAAAGGEPAFSFVTSAGVCGTTAAAVPSMKRTLVKDALARNEPLDSILLQGWVRTRRDAKAFSFIELNDGSCLKGIQVVADATLPDYAQIEKATTGAALEVHGQLVPSQGQGQKWEVVARSFKIVGDRLAIDHRPDLEQLRE